MQPARRRFGGLLDRESPTATPTAGGRERRSRGRALRSNVVFAVGAVVLVLLRFVVFHFIKRGPDTLVMYVIGFDDPESINNINYFLEHGVRDNDGAQYLLVVRPDYQAELVDVPIKIPPHMEQVRPSSRCYAPGLVGWTLRHAHLELSRYKYFIWLDSSVRGPFLPAYVKESQVPWHQLLTSQLDEATKLVGATISCSGVKLNASHPTYYQPHVQGSVVATDQVGLQLLLDDPGALECHTHWLSGWRASEIGASEVMLRNGYNIGSLMLRYAGVDFRDRAKWACNQRVPPQLPQAYDGINLHPLEVMFIKVHHHQVVTEHPAVVSALKYEAWAVENRTTGAEDINRNQFRHMSEVFLDGIIAKGPKCFDHELYISASPVELEGYDAERAWLHFIMFGFREGRPYRFAC